NTLPLLPFDFSVWQPRIDFQASSQNGWTALRPRQRSVGDHPHERSLQQSCAGARVARASDKNLQSELFFSARTTPDSPKHFRVVENSVSNPSWQSFPRVVAPNTSSSARTWPFL